MSSTIRRINRLKKGRLVISGLYDNPSHVLLIHYSCESFYDIKEGRTPRVTSIAVRYLKSAQTKSFSIHKVAERIKVPIDKIHEHYDELEKEMLKEFFDFANSHKDYEWVHWNMRDINYGFEAIENRFRVLGHEPFSIQDDRKVDLARILIDRYGIDYAGHPRLHKLMLMNNISDKDFLSGDDEAKAFENRDFVKLHQSTLRKVDVIHGIINRAAEDTLKTKSSIIQIYGLSPQGIFELTKDHWLFALLLAALGSGITLLIQYL